MYLKNSLFVLIASFGFCESAFGLTIINQTDSKKNIEIEEAYRPEAKRPGDLAAPISLVYKPQKIQVEANSICTIQLNVSCPVLIVGVTTIKKNSTHSTPSITTVLMCYEPYGYQGQNETLFTDDWGIVIHKPMIGENLGSPFDPNYSYRLYLSEKSKEYGYGIRCLHPKLLKKVTSSEDITEELLNETASSVPTRSY